MKFSESSQAISGMNLNCLIAYKATQSRRSSVSMADTGQLVGKPSVTAAAQEPHCGPLQRSAKQLIGSLQVA